MKKLVFALCCAAAVILTGCGSNSKGIIENKDGSISITRPDKDGSAIKYNQKYDGFDNVTVINGKAVKKLNPVTISLKDYKEQSILFDFSCDIKIEEESGKETDVVWMINEVSANLPQIARKKVPSGQWVTMKGSIFITIGADRSFYLSSAGMNVETKKIYLKNFKLTLAGEGIGKNAKDKIVDWMDAPSMKDSYAGIFDYVGIAVNYKNEFDKPAIYNGVARHADCVTPGNEFKPDFVFAWTRPKRLGDFIAEDGKTYQMPLDVPNFNGQAAFLKTCKEAGIKMRAHVLVWHSQTPDWFFKQDFNPTKPMVGPAEMTARQEWYIKTVMDFVADWEAKNNNGEHIIFAWDVVNEAISDSATVKRYLRDSGSNWYEIYKDSTFIINAFRFANKYAPKDVLLVYNDYNCYAPSKLQGICQLIDQIQATPDARIDCIGMQSHVKIDYPAVSGQNSFESAVQTFLNKGLDVQITELDIANGKNPYSPYQLKSKYKEYYQLFIKYRKTDKNPGISGVTVWGINDETTWLNAMQEYKGNTQYPLLFKKNSAGDSLLCKPAFNGVIEAAEEYKKSK